MTVHGSLVTIFGHPSVHRCALCLDEASSGPFESLRHTMSRTRRQGRDRECQSVAVEDLCGCWAVVRSRLSAAAFPARLALPSSSRSQDALMAKALLPPETVVQSRRSS